MMIPSSSSGETELLESAVVVPPLSGESELLDSAVVVPPLLGCSAAETDDEMDDVIDDWSIGINCAIMSFMRLALVASSITNLVA